MPPDEPNEEEELEALPEDYDTPFSIPDEGYDRIAGPDNQVYLTPKLGDTHPTTDAGIEPQELYDEGLSAAAGASEPNARDSVVGYHARKDVQPRGVDPLANEQRHPATIRSDQPSVPENSRYYRIIVRPRNDFVTFRIRDIGGIGHMQQLVGKRPNGSWATQAWLISKNDAHIDDGILVADSRGARELLMKLGSEPKYERDSIFTAVDSPSSYQPETHVAHRAE